MEKTDALQRNLKILRRVIHARSVVTFDYMGEKKIVEPFTLGLHYVTGSPVLKAYKSELFSNGYSDGNWELLEVDKIERLIATPIRAKSNRKGCYDKDEHISEIISTVVPPPKKLLSFFL